jgi:SlyX protein
MARVLIDCSVHAQCTKISSNTSMTQPHTYEDRLTDLEVKASFTEDLVEQLNQIIIRQQNQIDMLLHEVMALRQQIPEDSSGTQRNLRDDMPPHF